MGRGGVWLLECGCGCVAMWVWLCDEACLHVRVDACSARLRAKVCVSWKWRVPPSPPRLPHYNPPTHARLPLSYLTPPVRHVHEVEGGASALRASLVSMLQCVLVGAVPFPVGTAAWVLDVAVGAGWPGVMWILGGLLASAHDDLLQCRSSAALTKYLETFPRRTLLERPSLSFACWRLLPPEQLVMHDALAVACEKVSCWRCGRQRLWLPRAWCFGCFPGPIRCCSFFVQSLCRFIVVIL